MKKLSDKINIKKILTIYLLMQPVIDIITSLLVRFVSEQLTLGIIIRALFMVGIVIYSIIVSDKKDRIKGLIYYGLIAVYSIMYLIVCYNQNGMTMILSQFKSLVKILYLPLVLVALININHHRDIKIENKYFLYTLLEYTITICLSKILGIAFSSYEPGYKEGTEGLFYAANETGAILGILAPLLFIELFKEYKIINFISLVLLLFSILEIGTKVPFLSILGLILVYTIINFIKFTRKGKIKRLCTTVGVTILCTFVFLLSVGYMPIGKNMDINIIKTISEKMSNSSTKVSENEKTDKKDEETKIDITDTVSGRNIFLNNNFERYKNSPVLEKIFGNGYLTTIDGQVQENKMVEMDIFDIAFAHGIAGTILICLPAIYMVIIILIKLFKNIKKAFFSEDILLTGYSIAIGYGISLLAGHVLTAPAVAIYLVFNFITLYNLLMKIDKEK